MKDKILYYDHNNVLKLTLNEYPYFSEPSEFKDWVWSYNEQFGRINTFRRDKQNWPLVIGIAGDGLEYRDALCDIFSADVEANQPGRLVLRDWSLRCYITQAGYEYGGSNYDLDRKATFNVRAVDSTWIREFTRSYSGVPGGGGGTDEDLWRDYVNTGTPGRGYNYGYNLVATHSADIELAGASGNGYKIVFYGPATDPVVYINNKPIQVFVELDDGDRLEIVSNGGEKTIYIIKSNGFRINAFNYRDKENSPFLNLGGDVSLSYGKVRFDLTTIERRSEPTWILSTNG